MPHTVGPRTGATSESGVVVFDDSQMVPLANEVYVDSAMTARQRGDAQAAYNRAVARVWTFYGELQSGRPATFFCASNPCRLYFTGPAMRSWNLSSGHSAPGGRYVARKRTIIIDYMDRRTEDTTVHEMSHVEFAFRIAPARAPEWFNEGLATYIGREPNCYDQPPDAVVDLRTLDGHRAWLAQTKDKPLRHATYCQALREFTTWFNLNGKSKLMRLFDALKRGETFEAAYGPLAIPPTTTH